MEEFLMIVAIFMLAVIFIFIYKLNESIKDLTNIIFSECDHVSDMTKLMIKVLNRLNSKGDNDI